MTKSRDVNPTVVLMPTMLLYADGEMMDPSVSVPKVPAANPSAAATALPLELPLGSCSGTVVHLVCRGDVVFDEDGDSMQWPLDLALLSSCILLGGYQKCIWIYFGDRLEIFINVVDSSQVGIDKVYRCEKPVLQALCEIVYARVQQRRKLDAADLCWWDEGTVHRCCREQE
ncbi:uncharacterized protein PgNI_02848 [Pyricularia grisea]|uniref:Uncharacterized protein n=1 Tax=Pyricularia grisea TaxID=148305 RepID=A0A6P8BAK8_PYRGI|nr:uncharacterized protein PgNI_02848 [Pyricularia grisea]TLD12860.1 hypothetical protein PgNI_02848 [Pyricularia grisea]